MSTKSRKVERPSSTHNGKPRVQWLSWEYGLDRRQARRLRRRSAKYREATKMLVVSERFF